MSGIAEIEYERYWFAIDDAVQIEFTAANLAILVEECGLSVLGQDARLGWDCHELGLAPRPISSLNVLAGWLARQIWCHERGDDSEHVERSELEAGVKHAADVHRGTYYPDYTPHDANKFSQVLKMFSAADDVDSLRQAALLFILDPSFHREDITVAIGRVEREKGWDAASAPGASP